MRRLLTALLVVALPAGADAQEASLEYRVKAAFLLNFTRFIDWPSAATGDGGPLTICVAERNPFGAALASTAAGETSGGRPIATIIVDNDVTPCQVLFVPRGVSAARHLRRVGDRPVLTVGEADDFIEQGGVVNFVLEAGRVRFEINPKAAERHQLKVSSRLLGLARVREASGGR
jgi:hypothetical protein